MRPFNVLLVITVVATLAFALTQKEPTTPVSDAAAPAANGMVLAAPAPAAAEVPSDSLEGEVLEVIDVPSYTYLRIGDSGGAGTWAAVSTAKVEKGSRVRVVSATKLQGFRSETLDRSFDLIYFGALETSGGSAPTTVQAGSAVGTAGDDPHGKSQPTITVPAGKVDKATGPNALRIAELFAQKDKLSGKTVRVRGIVVKSTSGILGKTFLHLRDGSGDEKSANHDLSVTTVASVSVGDTVTVSGPVTLGKDIGAGYRYDVIVEEAQIETN
jgi:hypothetical protein